MKIPYVFKVLLAIIGIVVASGLGTLVIAAPAYLMSHSHGAWWADLLVAGTFVAILFAVVYVSYKKQLCCFLRPKGPCCEAALE